MPMPTMDTTMVLDTTILDMVMLLPLPELMLLPLLPLLPELMLLPLSPLLPDLILLLPLPDLMVMV